MPRWNEPRQHEAFVNLIPAPREIREPIIETVLAELMQGDQIDNQSAARWIIHGLDKFFSEATSLDAEAVDDFCNDLRGTIRREKIRVDCAAACDDDTNLHDLAMGGLLEDQHPFMVEPEETLVA